MVRIAIIWGGASGMMVAATLAEAYGQENIQRPHITLFEKNASRGAKIRISWWGRCNVTTGYYKKQDLASKYTRWRDFLSYAMAQFWPRKMMQRCNDHGCPVYCQEDMRCFPLSNNGDDIVSLFTTILTKHNVDMHANEPARTLHKKTLWSSSVFSLTTDKKTYEYDIVVITTWGNAYGHTGSTGDGYALTQSLGHTITQLWPSLHSFLVSDERIKECSGISFPHAVISSSKKKQTEKIAQPPTAHETPIRASWPLLFTHFGISGPATFAYASQIAFIPVTEKSPVNVYCRPYAEYDVHWREMALQNAIQKHPRQHLLSFLAHYFPSRWCNAFCKEYGFIHDRYIANLSGKEKNTLTGLFGDGFPLTLTARRPGDEFVTAWGVDTTQVDPRTMESLICPWLFFAGEVLNIDAVTGWFNFQACRATGRCAGTAIGNHCNKDPLLLTPPIQ